MNMSQLSNQSLQQNVANFQSFSISTLNCRGLRKTADPSIRNGFIRYPVHIPLTF
jgi:hypothetical protein